MVRALFKHDIRSNWAIFIIILALLMMYFSVIAMMYDPKEIDALQGLMKLMPQQLTSAMGFSTLDQSLTGFIAGYYYGFVIILFPMIYCFVLAGRLICSYVDRRSMAYLLSSPVKRARLATTQAFYFVSSLFVLFGINSLMGLAICEAGFPGLLDLPKYWTLNLMSLILMLSIAGIGYFFSCTFDDAKLSSAFGTGIPLFFYVVNMLSNVDAKLSWLKHFTIFSLFDTGLVIKGSSVLPDAVMLIIIALAGFIGGIVVFSRRDMAL
jgi:ABC-2 type transport system permease protein